MRKIKRGSIKPTRTIENKIMTDENTTAVPEVLADAPADASITSESTDAPADVPAEESTDTAADLAPLDVPASDEAPVEVPTTTTPEIIATDAAPAPAVETPAPVVEAPVPPVEPVVPVETPAPAETPVVPVETPAPVETPVTPAVVETPAADLEPLDTNAVHPVTTHIRNLLDSYYAEMRPGYPTNADQGKFKQRHLESVYKQVLARTEGEFDIAMEALLAYVDEHRNGVFAEGYVFRFMAAAWPSAQNRSFFETFTALILRIHDPKSRGIVLRQSINYINVLKKLLKPEEAERLQGFIEKYL